MSNMCWCKDCKWRYVSEPICGNIESEYCDKETRDYSSCEHSELEEEENDNEVDR